MADQFSPARRGAPRPVGTTAGLLLTGVVALAAAVVLGTWVVDQLGSTRLWRVEAVVAPALVTVGALAAGWVGMSALVAAACAAARTAGSTWRAGEVVVQRWAPGLVRRALAVAVAASVGLGSAAGAHAAVVTPSDAPAVAAVDLGWTPTTGDAAGPTTTTVPDGGSTSAPLATPSALPQPEQPAAPPATEVPRAGADVPDDAPGTHSDVAPTTTAAGPDDAGAPTSSGAARRGLVLPVSAPLPPAAAGAAAEASTPTPATGTGQSVEVRVGDTLWGLAARALGPGASDAAIAAEWPRWYAANASVIGPDPDVLQPGQVLVAPTSDHGSAR